MDTIRKMMMLMGGGGVAFTPSIIPVLRLWLSADTDVYQDAAGTTPATADGHPVGLWKDQTANSYDVSQSTDDNRPLLKLAANGINGKAALLFDGSNDLLSRTVANWLSTDSEGSIFVVYKIGALSNNATLLSTNDTEAVTTYFRLESTIAAATTVFNCIQQRNIDTADRVYGDTTVAINTTYITVLRSSGTAYTIRINGEDESLTAASGANKGDWFADTTLQDNFSIGGSARATPALFFNGLISEILVFGSNLTGANLSNMETYLADKYGVTLP